MDPGPAPSAPTDLPGAVGSGNLGASSGPASAPTDLPGAVGSGNLGASSGPAKMHGSSFEVTFAQPGSIGIDFTEHRAPYVVKAVHQGGVASTLGIESGDELVAVGQEAVAGFEWSQLVEKLTPRPVQVSFYRHPKVPLVDRQLSALEELDLSNCNIQADAGRTVGALVAKCPNLQRLNLGGNTKLGTDTALKALVEAAVGGPLPEHRAAPVGPPAKQASAKQASANGPLENQADPEKKPAGGVSFFDRMKTRGLEKAEKAKKKALELQKEAEEKAAKEAAELAAALEAAKNAKAAKEVDHYMEWDQPNSCICFYFCGPRKPIYLSDGKTEWALPATAKGNVRKEAMQRTINLLNADGALNCFAGKKTCGCVPLECCGVRCCPKTGFGPGSCFWICCCVPLKLCPEVSWWNNYKEHYRKFRYSFPCCCIEELHKCCGCPKSCSCCCMSCELHNCCKKKEKKPSKPCCGGGQPCCGGGSCDDTTAMGFFPYQCCLPDSLKFWHVTIGCVPTSCVPLMQCCTCCTATFEDIDRVYTKEFEWGERYIGSENDLGTASEAASGGFVGAPKKEVGYHGIHTTYDEKKEGVQNDEVEGGKQEPKALAPDAEADPLAAPAVQAMTGSDPPLEGSPQDGEPDKTQTLLPGAALERVPDPPPLPGAPEASAGPGQ